MSFRRLGEFDLDDRTVDHGDPLVDPPDELRSLLEVCIAPGVSHRGQGTDHFVDVAQGRPGLHFERVDLGGDPLVLCKIRNRGESPRSMIGRLIAARKPSWPTVTLGVRQEAQSPALRETKTGLREAL